MFLSGLVFFLKQVRTLEQFLKAVQYNGGYLLAVTGLTIVLVSLLFLEKDSAEKE